MRTNNAIVLLALSVALVACGSGSSLPEATGKATVRAINAIEGSTEVGFLIEERLIGNIAYKGVTPFAEWDDLEYTFNFDILFAGDSENTRIASRTVDVVANQDYAFLLSGTVAAPVLTLWENEQVAFDSGGTDLRVRFGHASASVGTVDYYFAAAGVAPVAGQAVASLAFGERSDPLLVESGEYVLTITAAGDVNNVLYTSFATQFAAQSDFTIVQLDGDFDDTSSLVVRATAPSGVSFAMQEANSPSVAEFVHAALDLGAVDIYRDEMLTSQVTANHSFQQRTAEFALIDGDNALRYTPAGDTANVTATGNIITRTGLRFRMLVFGANGSYNAIALLQDRAPVDTAAKIAMFHTASNFATLDFYIVNAGVLIDNQLAFRSGVALAQPLPAAGIAPGSYDVYVTTAGEKTVLAGPLRIDVQFGDVVDLVVFDAVDPAVVDLQRLSIP